MQVLPDITVAAIVEQDGRFLLVEELAGGEIVFNQPAGHLDPGEDLLDAVIRETREETTCHFTPDALTGIYQWTHPVSHKAFLRFCFCGSVSAPDPALSLDKEILRTHWLDLASLTALRLRSPMVLRGIEDYLAGRRFPLDLYQMLGDPAPAWETS